MNSDVYQQLQIMLELHVPKSKIANSLGMSRPTLYKLLKSLNLQQNYYSCISNDQLDEVIKNIKSSHASAGEVMVQGHLTSQGINVQRHRLRNSLHRVDSEGIKKRRLHTIRRRIYNVPGPNFLWHLDGTHKLIRWRLVFHMGIDGFSRTIVFGQCSNNNRSSTVLSLFEDARAKFGNPLRVRTDEGGENTKVWAKMYELYPVRSNPVIVGSSVHNQRVERLHRDVNEQVGNHFYNTFFEMESSGILNPENTTDLFSLHYVFIPVINKALHEFIMAYNNHKISTEQNLTPLQLFHMYFWKRRNIHESEDQYYGGIPALALNKEIPYVDVPALSCPLNNEQYEELVSSVDPLHYDDPVVAYRQTASFIATCLLSA